jgi:hypothetical protein
MLTLDEQVENHQISWRRSNVTAKAWGTQGNVCYPWILPPEDWEQGLWPGIRTGSTNSVADYLESARVRRHGASNNLKSSWVLCANLYFPFGATEDGRSLLASFLHAEVDQRIRSVDRVELEYAGEGVLSPANLLGEVGGARGVGQTSPDVAFTVNKGQGLILTESKYAERSFYGCSARTTKTKEKRPGNPDPGRCLHAIAVLDDPKGQCHQVEWGRKYWDHLGPVLNRDALSRLNCCPAALAGYQLFRQHALAEGIANSNKYNFVVSCAATDKRNDVLSKCLVDTGIEGLEGWSGLFRGRARFTMFSHQQWVAWVRQRDSTCQWREWLKYVEQRYDFVP